MNKCLLLITAMLALSACTASGPEYHGQQAKLIVYRPSSVMGAAHAASVELNGKPLCDINVGGFAIANEGGNLTATHWYQPGTSRINVASGYVKVEQRSTWGAAAGMVGMLAVESATQTGPFQFTVVPGSVAKEELKGLSQQCI